MESNNNPFIDKNEKSKIEIYQLPNGTTEISVNFQQESVWLNLNQMATLFGRDKSVISRHLKNIFNEQELDRNSTVAFFATVQNEGKREVVRSVEYFNLDAIISVGYRVNSKQWVIAIFSYLFLGIFFRN